MLYDKKYHQFYLEDNKIFSFEDMRWLSVEGLPSKLIMLSHQDAVKKLQKSPHKIKIPVGVIGSNDPTSEQYTLAEKIGKSLAELGIFVICGGRYGIMEAVCKGVFEAGGISIGLLPEINTNNANKFVSIPVATGVGLARNSIIAAASLCLIAIGGGYGTLSEIAYGLQFGKKVFSIACDLTAVNMHFCKTHEEVINNICKTIFNIEVTAECEAETA